MIFVKHICIVISSIGYVLTWTNCKNMSLSWMSCKCLELTDISYSFSDEFLQMPWIGVWGQIVKSRRERNMLNFSCSLEKFQISPHLSCGEISHFSTTVMQRNLKYLHMTNFSPQAPPVMPVTNMRYVYPLSKWNVWNCRRRRRENNL